MSYLAVRHGQTTANLRNVFAGRQIDCELTPEGRNEALLIAEDLRAIEFNPVSIFSSSLKRSRDSIRIISEVNNYNAPIIELPDLDEFDFGEFTDGPRQVPHDRFVNGKIEPFKDFEARVGRAVAATYSPDEDILVITHAMVLSMMQYFESGGDFERFYLLNPFDQKSHVREYAFDLSLPQIKTHL